MALSLLALALFIGYWLKQSYNIEREALVEKASVLFADSANKAEREFWHTAFIDMVETVVVADDGDVRTVRRPLFVTIDSILAEPHKNHLIKSATDTTIFIESGRNHRSRKSRRDELRALFFQNIDSEVIRAAIADSLAVAVLDIDLELIPVYSDSTVMESASWQGDFFQLDNGDFGAAQIVGGSGQVIRKMIPVILFSIGLFTLSALAFMSLLRHLRKQRLLSNQQREFMYNMTHELKTPVTTIGLALEAIQDQDLKQTKRNEYLGLAGQGVQRLQGMIERVLQSSQLDKNEFLMNPQLTRPFDITKSVIDNQQLSIDSTNSQSQLNVVTKGENIEINADHYHISNALDNLVQNALKHGGNGVSVEVECESNNSGVTWKVSDDGPGIGKEHIPFIFDKFYRVSQGKTHNVKGYGLGLHYALSVARQHGGDLSYVSNGRTGASFLMTIPGSQNG